MTATAIPDVTSRPVAHGIRRPGPRSHDPAVPRHRSTCRRRPSERTYRRRRAAISVLVAGIVGAAGLVAGNVLTGPGGVPASAAGAGTAPPPRAVRIHAGDSLWSIAERFRGAVPITDYVAALISRNGGTHIEVGQVVLLP